MTIQLPVLIWTVISFCVLMLVLDRLLFRPLLSFMDARQAKIDAALAKREQAEKALAEAEKTAEEARLASEKQARADMQAALDAARHDAAKRTQKKEQEYTARMKQAVAEIETERQTVRQKLDTGMEDLISAFVEKLAL